MSALAQADAATNRNPTEGQARAGNYAKGRLRLHGMEISIENPRGSMRHGTGDDGKRWSVRMPVSYGYIKRTVGADDSHVDCFIGPHLKSPHAFVIDQVDLRAGDFDEHKIMLGFGSEKQAREAYAKAFSDGRGKARIGHVECMSIEGLKKWLRDGNTKAPIKRAEGGGVRDAYAGGGAPSFDETTEVPSFDQTEPVVDNGKLDAFGRGAAQGATFNFADEIAGARAAAPKIPGTSLDIPEFVGPIPARTLVGAARTGIDTVRGEPTPEYDKGRDEFRAADEAAKKAHPYIHGAGELTGAVAGMAAAPEAGLVRGLAPTAGKAARFLAGAGDAATQGGIYGGASGAGEGKDIGERALEGAKGIVSGIVGGGMAHGASETARAAFDKFGQPIVSTVRGWINPEGEASRRLANALRIDQDLIQQGKAQGMPPAEWAAARQRGEPVTLADLGSANTQSLLRSAANTSPEARATLENTFEQRFLGQSERVGDTVRGILPGGQANARKTGDQLVAEYDQARVPAYKAAYQQGDKPLMSPAMERLMGSDTFVGAMKRAISTGKDRDIEMGLGGFNPMVNVTPDGRIIFNKGAQGAPTYPNLQYWDQVKRELDSVANQAKRSGDTSSSAGALAKILRNELDQQVPGYAKARGVAEQFFGESNALEAGRTLAGKKPVAEDVAAVMRKMDPKERELFQEGYASDLAERVIGRMKDTQNVTKAMFNSPNERKLAATIFGSGGMAQLRARMALETIMNGARDAMGNSTTARQLIEAGLAGGALTGYATGWDPVKMIGGAGAAAGARYGAGTATVVGQMASGAQHLIGKVDAKTARRVAELLTSNDPRLLREGYQMAAKNDAIGNALMSLARKVSLAGQAQAREPISGTMKALQGPMTGRADEQQQSP